MAAGIINVSGKFNKGDHVKIVDKKKDECARELVKELPNTKIFLGGLGTRGIVDGELQTGVILANKDTMRTLNKL